MADGSPVTPAAPPAPAPIVFSGAISKKKKTELEALAIALSIDIRDSDKKKKKKELLAAEIHHKLFKESPTLENDPRFKALYETQRKEAQQSQSQAANSATKAGEDSKEGSKPAKALTGANLKLFDSQVTVDPPASFGRLSGKNATKQTVTSEPRNKRSGDGESSPLSSASSLPSLTGKEGIPSPPIETSDGEGHESVEEKQTQVLEKHKTTQNEQAPVLVNFQSIHNPHMGQAVVVNAAVKKSQTADGSVIHTATLSTLVPAAVEHSSPIKADLAGRLSRAGFASSSVPYGIGSIRQILQREKLPALEFARANNVELKEEEGLLSYDIFYQPGFVTGTTQTAVQPTTSVQPITSELAMNETSTPVPTSLTGDGTDRPLEIAQARAAQSAQAATAPVISSSDFSRLLRLSVGEDKEIDKVTNSTAGDGVMSYIAYTSFLQKFKVFAKKGGGYVLGSDWEAPSLLQEAIPGWQLYRNKTFTQKDIQQAAGLKAASTKINQGYYSNALKLKGSLGDWVRMAVKTPRDEWTETEENFADMAYGRFGKMVDKQVQKANDNKPLEISKRKRSASTKKGKKVLDSESSDEEPAAKKSKKAKSKPGRKDVDTSDEDEDESEDADPKKKGKGKARNKVKSKAKSSPNSEELDDDEA